MTWQCKLFNIVGLEHVTYENPMNKLQVAQKDHICTDCGKKIAKGTKYWRDRSDDQEQDGKVHTNCVEHETLEDELGIIDRAEQVKNANTAYFGDD